MNVYICMYMQVYTIMLDARQHKLMHDYAYAQIQLCVHMYVHTYV